MAYIPRIMRGTSKSKKSMTDTTTSSTQAAIVKIRSVVQPSSIAICCSVTALEGHREVLSCWKILIKRAQESLHIIQTKKYTTKL